MKVHFPLTEVTARHMTAGKAPHIEAWIKAIVGPTSTVVVLGPDEVVFNHGNANHRVFLEDYVLAVKDSASPTGITFAVLNKQAFSTLCIGVEDPTEAPVLKPYAVDVGIKLRKHSAGTQWAVVMQVLNMPLADRGKRWFDNPIAKSDKWIVLSEIMPGLELDRSGNYPNRVYLWGSNTEEDVAEPELLYTSQAEAEAAVADIKQLIEDANLMHSLKHEGLGGFLTDLNVNTPTVATP